MFALLSPHSLFPGYLLQVLFIEFGRQATHLARGKVVEGRNLVKKDIIGLLKSDPYAVIEGNGRRFQTSVIRTTQHPVWNETFELYDY